MNIASARTAAANSDLRAAQKRGEILIGQTTLGTVALRRTETGYELVTQGIEPKVLASGPKAVVRKALEPLYVIS